MRVSTIEEAREFSTISEAFPGMKIKNSKLIQIINDGFSCYTLGDEVKQYLADNAMLLKESCENAGLKGFIETGAHESIRKTYSAGEEGKIIYDEASIIGKYASAIRLVNFDRRKSTYRKLLKDFEGFANADTSREAFLRKFGITEKEE